VTFTALKGNTDEIVYGKKHRSNHNQACRDKTNASVEPKRVGKVFDFSASVHSEVVRLATETTMKPEVCVLVMNYSLEFFYFYFIFILLFYNYNL
jgi:hypothetical protein